MNFLITLVYMYIMLTFIYPVVSNTFGYNNQLGFFLFVFISFISIHLFGNWVNKKVFDLSKLVDKNLYSTFVVVSTKLVLDDLSELNITNTLGKYILDSSKGAFEKNVIVLSPLIILHILRALLKPY